MTRYCICGKSIWHTKTLCEDCINKYGSDRSKWEGWLLEWAKSMDREYKQESRHKHLQIFDETERGEAVPLSNEAKSNFMRAMNNPNMDFEDFIWDNV